MTCNLFYNKNKSFTILSTLVKPRIFLRGYPKNKQLIEETTKILTNKTPSPKDKMPTRELQETVDETKMLPKSSPPYLAKPFETEAWYYLPSPAQPMQLPSKPTPVSDLDFKDHKKAVENYNKFTENRKIKEDGSTKQHKLESAEQEVLATAEKKRIVNYASAGSHGDNSSPRLTRTGYDLDRATNPQNKVKKLQTDTSEKGLVEDPKISKVSDKVSYVVDQVEIGAETLILTPVQTHLVIAKENLEDSNYLTGIAILTSEKGTKVGLNGVPGPENLKLSDTQLISGQNKEQYGAVLIPL